MRIVVDTVPEGAMLARIMVDDTWSYDQMTLLVFKDSIVHIKGWIGKSPSRELFQAIRDLFPTMTHVSWERIRGDGSIHAVLLPLPEPNEIPAATLIVNPC